MKSEGLPFLVVQGGWFWIVLLVVRTALIFGLILASTRVIRLQLARRKRREMLARMRQHCAQELHEGQITLSGQWCGDAIDAHGERVTMGDWRGATQRDASIQHREPVLVTGDLRLDVAAVGGDAAATRHWYFVGAMAYRDDPKVRLEGLSRTSIVTIAVVTLLASYSALRILGDRLVAHAKHREYLPGDGGPLVLTNLQSLTIAASLPGSRDDALDTLASALKQHPYHDEASVERQRDLARLQDGPCAAVGFLKASGRYVEEIDLAQKC